MVASLPAAHSSRQRTSPADRGGAADLLRFARAGAVLVVYKAGADIVSKSVTLVVTVAAARALPAADFGVMALAMTTGWLLGVASDAGLPMHLATQVAHAQRDGRPVYPIVRAVVGRRTELAAVAVAAGAAAGLVFAPFTVWVAFTLIVLHQVFGAMLDTVSHAFRGLGRTDIESSLTLGHRGAIAAGALTALAVQPTLLNLSMALAIPPLVTLVVASVIVRRLTADGPAVPLTPRRLLTDVAPLGFGVFLSAVYFRCDVYFIERLHGVEAVGVYNAAFRIVDALRLFPAAALAVAYPLLCAATDHRRVRSLSFGLLAASAFVAVAVSVSAPGLLVRLYGEPFAVGSQALQILACCIPFFYVNYALTHQLIAWEGQRAYLVIAATALFVNLTGNVLLIPESGIAGAAVSTLVTELVVLIGCAMALVHRR